MLTIHEAVNALNGDRHKKISEASAEIDKALGITSENHPAIGAWADNSMMVVSPGAPTAQIRAASAMKGYVADPKGTGLPSGSYETEFSRQLRC